MRVFILILILVGVVVVMFGATGAVAQEDDGEAARGSAVRLFDHFIVGGGVITWFVLIPLSVATVALIIEHSVSIRRDPIAPPSTLGRIREDIEARRYVDTVRFTADEPSMLAEVVHSGLVRAGEGYAAMQEAMAEATYQRTTRMMRKIEYLNVIGNVSPMIGLLGTVYGMIRLFASIRLAGGIPEPAVIANDISIALVTTFWGLLVAIPALAMFAFLRNRIDELTEECAATAERLLETFKPSAAPETQETERPRSPSTSQSVAGGQGNA